MHRNLFYAVVLTLLFMIGCVNALQTRYAWSDKMYPGPYRERSRIALLVQNEAQRVHLEEINGSAAEKELGVVFELLPGRHLLCIGLTYSKANTKYYSKKCQVVELTARAGHTYEFYADEKDTAWRPAVRDITNELGAPGMEKVAKKIEAMLLNARKRQAE